MVSFYQSGKKNRKKSPPNADPQCDLLPCITIDTWDPRGRGVCRTHQPVLFVDGVLPGEECDVRVVKKKTQVWEGVVSKVNRASEKRQVPFCQLAGECGGCDLQHVDPQSSLTWRQAALDSQFKKQHGFSEINWVTPIHNDSVRYRRKTRLAVDARSPKNVRVGYRAAKSTTIIKVTDCPVLRDNLNLLLPLLQGLVTKLQGAKFIGHISLLEADNGLGVTFRCVRQLNHHDKALLTEFAIKHSLLLRVTYPSKSGKDNSETLHQVVNELSCAVGDTGMISVSTEDFVQVNAEVNHAMINQAIAWLAPHTKESVLDLFCGVGNFSIPLAKHFGNVTAIEGVSTMVQRATKTAQIQELSNVKFKVADLNDPLQLRSIDSHNYDKILLDPSREGAFEVCKWIAASQIGTVVYVSCNPATFNRDLSALLAGGFELSKVGLMEMFPFTQHLELMALLQRSVADKRQ